MSLRNDTRGQAANDPWPVAPIVAAIVAGIAYEEAYSTLFGSEPGTMSMVVIVICVFIPVFVGSYWLMMTGLYRLHQRVVNR